MGDPCVAPRGAAGEGGDPEDYIWALGVTGLGLRLNIVRAFADRGLGFRLNIARAFADRGLGFRLNIASI